MNGGRPYVALHIVPQNGDAMLLKTIPPYVRPAQFGGCAIDERASCFDRGMGVQFSSGLCAGGQVEHKYVSRGPPKLFCDLIDGHRAGKVMHMHNALQWSLNTVP